MSVRVVFDRSTLISAAIRPDSVPDQALSFAVLNHCVCTCTDVLRELNRVLTQPKFDRYVPAASRVTFFEKFLRDSLCVEVPNAELVLVKGACRDPNDGPFLALCLAARADVLVSSDQDLLVLHPWQHLPIVTPAQFLSLFGKAGSQ